MDEYQVHLKIKEALEALKAYEKNLNEGKTGMWKSDIDKNLKTLTEKRHMLGSSGEQCPQCGGSGRA